MDARSRRLRRIAVVERTQINMHYLTVFACRKSWTPIRRVRLAALSFSAVGAFGLLLAATTGSAWAASKRTVQPVAPPTDRVAQAPDIRRESVDRATLDTRRARQIAEEFDRLADQVMATGHVVGMATALVHRGEVLSARGHGVTDSNSRQPVDPDTVFRLASLTKGITGSAAALLVREGFIQWDEPVSPLLPQFALGNADSTAEATVRDVLSHRMGLAFNSLDRMLEADALYHDLVALLRDQPLRCPVGDCYGYQNIAFSLIGDVTFSTSGEFFPYAVERRLFVPLGMTRSTFGLDALTLDNNWARPHTREGQHFAALFPKPTYYRVLPAAGANASIDDMARWAIAQLGHRPDVLPDEVLEEIHAPEVDTPGEIERVPWRVARVRHASYGLGWRVYDYSGHRLIFHGGAVQGFRGMIALLPEQDFGVVVLWNNEAAVPSGLVPTVIDRVLGFQPVDWLELANVTPLPVLTPRRVSVGQSPAR